VRSQLDDIFDHGRNAYGSCQLVDITDIFELPEATEYMEKIDSGDQLLQAQDVERSGGGLLHDHSSTSGIGEAQGIGDHHHTDNNTDRNLPNTDICQRLPESTIVRSYPLDEEDAPPGSIVTVIHNWHSWCENDTDRQTAAITKQSCQPPPPPPYTNHVPRCLVTTPTNALIIMVKALASTSINHNPSTYVEVLDSPPWDYWTWAMGVECTSILLNNTFTTFNPHAARQLWVKPIGSKLVYKMKYNSDGTIWYKALLEIKGYEWPDFRETYTPLGNLTTFWYVIFLVRIQGGIINHLDVVTALLNAEVDDDGIHLTLPTGWPEVLNAPAIIVQPENALDSLQHAPQHWQNNNNTCLLSLKITWSLADPSIYLRSDGIVIHMYNDNFSILYLEDAAKGAIEVKGSLSANYNNPIHGRVHQFLGIDMHCHEHGSSTFISLGQEACISKIFKRFNMQNAHNVSTPIHPEVKLDLAEDQGKKELKDIKVT